MADDITPHGDAPEGEQGEKTTDWQAEARKWEARSKENLRKAKENESAAQRLAEIEEAQKTESQKLIERAEAAERALAQQQTEALRLRVAAKHGITEDYLDLLTGTDEAELEARAVKVASLITPTEQPKKGAWAPFDPEEGGQPGAGKRSVADQFADWSDQNFQTL